MKDYMEYKGYYGDASFSPDDHVFYGKLQGIGALVDYSGDTVAELETSFHEAVEDYVAFCEEEGIETERAFPADFMIDLPVPLQAKIIDISSRKNISISKTIEQAVEAYEG